MPDHFTTLLDELGDLRRGKAIAEAAIARQRRSETELAELRSRDTLGKALRNVQTLGDQAAAERSSHAAVLAKATPVAPFDFMAARQTLMEAARSGKASSVEIAKAESLLNKLGGRAMMKAADFLAKAELVVPNNTEANAQSRRAKQHTTQTDFHAAIRMLQDTLRQHIGEGKHTAISASKAEGRINELLDVSENIHNASCTMRQRQAAVSNAVAILRSMMAGHGMSELDVAPIEAQLHSLGHSLGMGVAGDVPDPLVA